MTDQDKVGQSRARARRGGPLSDAARSELQAKAWDLHIGGYGYRQIAAELGVSKDTISCLIHDEAEQRSVERVAHRRTDMERAIATYELEIRQSLAFAASCKGYGMDRSRSDHMRNAMMARVRLAKILGLESVRRLEVRAATTPGDELASAVGSVSQSQRKLPRQSESAMGDLP
jgi:hypothetical protein